MIYTEETPNPNAIKFVSKETFSEVGTEEFQKKDIEKINNNFIKSLLSLDGVELVLISENFISVKKEAGSNWNDLKPSIISGINDYFLKNKKPVLTKINNENNKKEKSEDDDIIKKINEVLESKIRPAVARDGGDIKFVSFKNGTVKVELRGSCSGCPSSLMTLKNGVQNLLRHYVKGVNNVEAS
tara:strand:+ start:243 stop:797 length:555 start_codon:yes stop_codon:yes gene_type:complete